MKYLKYFETEAAYASYKNGSEFVLPNVSYTEDGNLYYNPYVEPAWKKEGRLIRNAANGIGLAALGYVVISLLSGKFYDFLMGVLFPSANIHGMLYVTEAAEWIFDIVTYVISIVVPFGIYMLCMRMPLSVALPFKKPKTDMAIGGILISLGTSVLASYAVSS